METMKVTLYSAHEYLPCSPYVIHLILHFKARVLVLVGAERIDCWSVEATWSTKGEVESAEAENVGNLLLSTVCVNGSLSRPEFGCFVTVSRVQLHFWSTLRHTSVTPVMHPGHLTQLWKNEIITAVKGFHKCFPRWSIKDWTGRLLSWIVASVSGQHDRLSAVRRISLFGDRRRVIRSFNKYCPLFQRWSWQMEERWERPRWRRIDVVSSLAASQSHS